VFPNSLGVNRGEPEAVEIEFASRVAPYVRERTWHPSQRFRDRPDGSVLVSLEVCCDRALKTWILGWGPFARVVSPRRLAEEILDELDEARARYAPPLELELPRALYHEGTQSILPFSKPLVS
jgi:predicted DNA-binding transcriptional regulator YafY